MPLCHPKCIHVFRKTLFSILKVISPLTFIFIIQIFEVVIPHGERHVINYPMGGDTEIMPLHLIYLHHHPTLLKVKYSFCLCTFMVTPSFFILLVRENFGMAINLSLSSKKIEVFPYVTFTPR